MFTYLYILYIQKHKRITRKEYTDIAGEFYFKKVNLYEDHCNYSIQLLIGCNKLRKYDIGMNSGLTNSVHELLSLI